MLFNRLIKVKDNLKIKQQEAHTQSGVAKWINGAFLMYNKCLSNEKNIIFPHRLENAYSPILAIEILDWPKVIETSSNKFEPHRIPFYLYELATLFHSYWSKGNEDKKFKFILVDGDKTYPLTNPSSNNSFYQKDYLILN